MKFILLMTLWSCALQPQYKKNDIFNEVGFVIHAGSGPFDSYLQMNINFSPIRELYLKLDQELEGKLNKQFARTEAHITVITPIEYTKILKPSGISIQEINSIALDLNIQKSNFEIVCLARATRNEKQTYYLVVESKNLLKIRREVFKLFLKKGGAPSHWDPELFYPHITIGYTHKDLHLESDAIYKGLNSCWKQTEFQ